MAQDSDRIALSDRQDGARPEGGRDGGALSMCADNIRAGLLVRSLTFCTRHRTPHVFDKANASEYESQGRRSSVKIRFATFATVSDCHVNL